MKTRLLIQFAVVLVATSCGCSPSANPMPRAAVAHGSTPVWIELQYEAKGVDGVAMHINGERVARGETAVSRALNDRLRGASLSEVLIVVYGIQVSPFRTESFLSETTKALKVTKALVRFVNSGDLLDPAGSMILNCPAAWINSNDDNPSIVLNGETLGAGEEGLEKLKTSLVKSKAEKVVVFEPQSSSSKASPVNQLHGRLTAVVKSCNCDSVPATVLPQVPPPYKEPIPSDPKDPFAPAGKKNN